MRKAEQHNNINTKGDKNKNGLPFFQPKLSINQPGDVYEQEADEVAEKVMRMKGPEAEQTFFTPPAIQRKPARQEEEEKKLQKKEAGKETAIRLKENSAEQQVNTISRLSAISGNNTFNIQAKCAHCEEEERKVQKKEAIKETVVQPKEDKALRHDISKIYNQPGTSVTVLPPPVQRKCTHCEEEERRLQKKEAVTEATVLSAEDNTLQHDINKTHKKTENNITVLPPVQRKCAHCEEEEERLQRKESNGQAAQANEQTENYITGLSGGAALNEGDRSFFESRMGHDFSGVRIHNDGNANESAKNINALAYTHGSNIVFGAGQYQPGSDEGKKLLAHELTHVVQQSGGSTTSIAQKPVSTAKNTVQRRAVLGPAVDGFQPILSDSNTVAGIFSDVVTSIQPAALAGWPHVIVFTQGGLDVFETNSHNLVAHYGRRTEESLPNDGLWDMDNTGGVAKFGFRDGAPVTEGRAMEITGFSPPRQAIIQERAGISFLDDFTMTTATELNAHSYLPALVMVRELPASGTGESATPQMAPWAQGQVQSVQQLFTPAHQGTGSQTTGVTASERNMSVDQSTPDRLVPWPRSDGRQFVNVWVGGRNAGDNGVSEAVELQEGESTESLQSRIQQATRQLRQRLTQRAASAEETMTHGNIPFSDSTFTGQSGNGPTANRPAYRADITGPDIMTRTGTGTYNMRLHYEDVDPTLLGQVAEAFGGSDYTWQIIDITALYRRILEERQARVAQQQADLQAGVTPAAPARTQGESDLQQRTQGDAIDGDTTVSRLDASGRDASRTFGNFTEDIQQAGHDLVNPLSSQDGSAESAVRAVLMNTFNLGTIPLHAIMSLGGWLVRFFPAVFDRNHDFEREVPFPDQNGFYLVRCVAQPRPQGGGQILRLPSVASKVVEVKEIQQRTREELTAQSQNLESTILELLLAFRMENNADALRPIRAQLELKVQEAAQTNRAFLDQQISTRQTQLQSLGEAPAEGTTDPGQSIRQKLNEEISILQQGTRASSGTLAMILTRQIAIKEAELAAIPEWDRFRRRDAERALEILRNRLGTATARERDMEAGGQPIIRPHAVFVNEEDGRTIPLLIEMTQMGGRSPMRGYTFRISDVTGADSDLHEAIGPNKATAVRNVISEYAGHFPYGRGYLVIRIPESAGYGITEDIMVRCNPRDTAQASERLDELLQLLAILGLFVPGVGVAAAAIGAAVSAGRILNRIRNDTFQYDMNFVMDMLNILSAVASGVSSLANARLVRAQNMFALVEGDADMARWVTRLGRIARVAEFVDDAFNELNYMLGTMQTVQNYLEIQRQEAGGHISHADARRQRAQLITQGLNDQFMQHAPGVIQSMRERNRGGGQDEHNRRQQDEEQQGRQRDEEQQRRQQEGDEQRRRQQDQHDQQQGEDARRRQEEQEQQQDGLPVPDGTQGTHHTPRTAEAPSTPNARVEAFFQVRANREGILRGDQATVRRLLETHGTWRDLVMYLQGHPDNDMYAVAVNELASFRQEVVTSLHDQFGLSLSDPNASTHASSDIDLAAAGNDAGRRVLEAEEHMRRQFGAGWSELLRMNFYTGAERLFMYERVAGSMSPEAFGAMQREFSARAEILNFAKMLQHAGQDTASQQRVESMMGHLTEAQRTEVRTRAAETPAAASQEAARLLRQIDGMVTRFEAMAADDPRRADLAREITLAQMEANFRTTEAYISPGAGRHVVRGVAVTGHEAYQSAMANLEMMEHAIHSAGGNIETAVREYELYKYINRFIVAMTSAGLPMNSFMLMYYQASLEVYRNSRTSLQGVNQHDLSYLRTMHDRFVQEATQVLPQLRDRAQLNDASWNPEQRSLGADASGIGDTTQPRPTTPDTPITPQDVDRSFERTFGVPETPSTLPEHPHTHQTITPEISHPTADGNHTLSVSGDGKIWRCSECEQLLSTYRELLLETHSENQQLKAQLQAIEQRMRLADATERARILAAEVQPIEDRLRVLETERVRVYAPTDPDFHSPLTVGRSRRYQDAGGTTGTATRLSNDVTRIETNLGQTTTRADFQRDAVPGGAASYGVPVGTNGFDALHAIGPMVGHESPYGILLGPWALNHNVQLNGIETFLRDFGTPRPGVQFVLVVTVERFLGSRYPGVEFLGSVRYEVFAQGTGISERQRVFRQEVEVHQPDNPNSTFNISDPMIHPDINGYLAAPATAAASTTGAAGRRARRSPSDIRPATAQSFLNKVSALTTALRSVPRTDPHYEAARTLARELVSAVGVTDPRFVRQEMVENIESTQVESILSIFPSFRGTYGDYIYHRP